MQAAFGEKHVHVIDPKGRLQLARAVRDQLKLKKGDTLHLLPNVADPPFLEIRTAAQWDEYQRRFLSQAPGELKRDFVRFIQLHRETVVSDAQGRLIIPKGLRERCQLDGTVVVIHMTSCLEVWSPKQIERRYTDMAKAFRDINNTFF
jgi:division/cell wall cluster transcriptional repressor MraZ